jgi:hypothetical protein
VSGAGGGRKFMSFILGALLILLRDLEEIADLGYLAPGLGVVGLYGLIADLVQAQGVRRGNVLVKRPFRLLTSLILDS